MVWNPGSEEPSNVGAPYAVKHGSASPVSFIVRITVQRREGGEYGGWVEEAESREKTSFMGFGELRDALAGFLLQAGQE